MFVVGHNLHRYRTQHKSVQTKKGRITLKTGRSALFFNRIVQKSIKMGGYLINFPFLLKKKRRKSLVLQENVVPLQQVLRKVK